MTATAPYEVEIWHRSGTNRSGGARYLIQTATGTEEVVIDGLFALRDGASVLVEKTSYFGAPSES